MVYGVDVDNKKHYINIDKGEVDDFLSGKTLKKIVACRMGTFVINLNCTAKVLTDKDGEDIPLNSSVFIEESKNKRIKGTVVSYIDNSIVRVVDENGQGWSVSLDKLKKA